jgi:transcriptional regulator with XRE-family HTH domain
MAKRGDPKVLRFVVVFLRVHARMTQAQFGEASGIDQATVSRLELGHQAPSEEALHRMAKVAGIEWTLVAHLQQFYTSLLTAATRRNAGPAPVALDLTDLEPVLRTALTPYLLEAANCEPPLPSPDEQRREAAQIWIALEAHPLRFRRRLIELSPRSGDWALAQRVCEASLKSAARQPEEALELANLALSIAERFPGEEGWRSRLKGFCWAHVGIARQFAQDLAGAAEAFDLAQRLWQAQVTDPGSHGDWVLPTRQELFDRARAAAGRGERRRRESGPPQTSR